MLVGRRDPFLPIARLRARGQVNEIRAQDLRFTVEETEAFLENVLGTDIVAGMAGAWTEGSEGWVTAGLVLTYQFMQRPEHAANASQQLLEFARGAGESELVEVAESSRARLALLRGDSKEAIQWARSFDGEPHVPGMLFWLEVPVLTQARIQIAAGTDESLEKALESLGSLRQQIETLHNTYQLIGILALQVVAYAKQGKTDEARGALEQTLALAQSGSFLFPFLELGSPMADLLRRLLTEGAGNAGFIKRILTAFYQCNGMTDLTEPQSAGIPAPSRQQLPDTLTPRELEVLELLAQGLYQKEIAQRLFVSPETVKTHLKHIYRKPGVSNRRRAVDRGRALNLLARH